MAENYKDIEDRESMDQSSGEKLDQVEDQGQGSNDKEIDNSVEKKSSRLSTFIMMWMSIKFE